MDAVALAMITPDLMVITAGFISCLASGGLAAVLAALAPFGAPSLIVRFSDTDCRRFAQEGRFKTVLQPAAASAVAAISGTAYIQAPPCLFDRTAVLIGIVTLPLLPARKKIAGPVLILAAAAVKVLLQGPAQ